MAESVDTYTPILWVMLSADAQYEEYIRVRRENEALLDALNRDQSQEPEVVPLWWKVEERTKERDRLASALRDVIDAIPESTLKADPPLAVWVEVAESALKSFAEARAPEPPKEPR